MRMIEKVKKGLSVLLCLMMLVQYMPVTARAAETSDTVTVYFQNNWLWSEVSLYYWGSGGTNPEWPGYSMAFVENDGTYDVYKFEVPTDVTGFVINGIKDDGSGNRDQTPDITGGWYDGICYYMQWADGNQVGSYASYCEHSSHDTEGICGSCTANVGHSYDSTGFCSCGLECSHGSETNGVCDACGKTVSHTHNYVNGACSCGAAAQVLVTYNDSTTKYFETLQDALDTLSANNSDVTVKLLTNISVGDKVSADIYTHYTLDLNGYCLTANELVVPASGGMEIMDGSSGRTGQVNALVRAHGPLIIWGGTFNNTVLITTMSNVKGSVIVREGTFTAAADFQIADDACSLSLWDCAFPGGIKVEAVADASASKADLAAFPYYGRSYFLNCEEAVLTQGQSEISGDMVRVAYQVSHQFGTSNKCAACGLDAIVSMTLDGVTTYYGTVYDLRQDLVQENAGCTIQLLTDITTTYFADKDGRCGFYLDLNGHTLTASDGVSLPGSSGCTIMDTSAEKNGKIVGQVYAAYSTALTGGTIEGTVSFPKKASSTGYTFQMEGGTIDADMDFGINDNNTIIKLTGGSFPGGISIACGDNVITPKTLADCISGNYRYFQNGAVVDVSDGKTEITGGDVTVAVHAGHTHSYVNGFCELVEGETHYEPAILNDNGWYEIGNAGQLYWFAQQVDNGTGATYNAVLTADITDNPGTVTAESTGLRQWNPIGNDWNSCYNGIFDGNHKTISGLYFESTAKENNGAGLFTCIGYNATVKNVSLTNSYLHSYRYAGGIVGWNRGIIIDCVNHATISASAGHVGGVTGSNEGIIERCGNTGSVTSTNSEQNDDNAQYAGGVVGSQGQMKPGATLRNCWNTGSVNGTVCVGGVVGALTSAVVTIENCWSTGNVTGTESTTVGGVAGQVTNGKIINCYAPQATAVGEQATTATVTNVESKTLEQFASGEVTYLFQTRSANNLWGQDLDNGKTVQAVPTFDGALVYQIAANCVGAPGYSNTNENKGTHNYSENGFCINPDVNGNPCDDYQPAEKLTAERCAELGLDAAYDGYYAIKNAGNLYWFSQMVDTEYTTYNNANVVLIDDITVNEGAVTKDSTGIRVWNPIGSSSGKEDFSHAYNGTFDGNGHSISGLYFHEANTYGVGLIAAAGESAVVKDVTLSNSWFFGYINVGGIVALNKGAISGCANAADMDIYWQHLGGIAGMNYGTITGCSNSGTIGGWTTNTGIQNAVAGIAGGSYGTVEQCENAGNITSRHNSAGGIVGVTVLGAEVSKCRNTGDIKSATWAGGIVAHNAGTVTLCASEAAVTSGNHVGGIVGLNLSGTRACVKNCWSSGTVTGTDNAACVGGIVGTNSTANGCLNCWSTAAVTGTGIGAKAGGIVGYATTEECTKNGYTTHEKPVGEYNLLSDVDWDTVLTKTEEQFASGEVAYLLQKDQTEQVWGQNIDNGGANEGVPVFSDTKVYQIAANCAGDLDYSNINENKGTHNYSENGFCINPDVNGNPCDDYQPAEKLTAERCAELGLDAACEGWYAIGNAGQLYWFSQLVDEGDVNANAVLLNDIVVNQKVVNADGTLVSDASSLRVWKPIGKRLAHYRGVFDGNGKTVSGLYFNNSADASVDAPNENIGLIGVLAYGAVVKNVTVSDSYLYGNYSVGSVVGYNFGTISGCRNNSTVGASNYVGGVVGYNNNGTVELCANTGKIKAYDSNAGGIVGYCTGTVRNSWNTGEIDAVEACAGGIAGSLIGGNARVENCWTNDAVIYENGGGIAGLTDGTVTIRNCYTMHATAVGEARATAVITDVLTKTAAQFASGEIAYLLQKDQTEQVWGQDLDNGKTVQAVPTFDGALVYRIAANCAGDTGYSNTDASKVVHNYDDNGFCINPDVNGNPCDDYQPAEKLTAERCAELGLDAAYDGYYAIGNAGNLYWFAQQVDTENATFGAKNAVLIKDITINSGTVTAESTGLRQWNPIGDETNTFNGTFDGNHKTISGLYFNNENAVAVGLIASVGNAALVKDVTLTNSYLRGKDTLGGIVGMNYGTVTGCTSKATIVCRDNIAGGIVGTNFGTVEQCGNIGTVTSGNVTAGGIAGYSVGMVRNCWNSGNVTAKSQVAGIVAYLQRQTGSAGLVENCWSTGTVTGGDRARGIVGIANGESAIRNCYTTMSVAIDPAIGDEAVVENVATKTEDQFASGEVAYLLQTRADEGTNVWGQDLDNGKPQQPHPTFDGAVVYRIAANCAGNLGYSNTNENKGAHNYSENGFCINPDVNGNPCDDYQPAERLTAERCAELGLDATVYNGYYAIKNAGNLYWFADKVDNENATYGSSNAVLTDNITVNSGTVTAESTGLRAWNPIGYYNSDDDYASFNGIFDGNNKTVSGLYFNDNSAQYISLIAITGEASQVKSVTLDNSYLHSNMFTSGIVSRNNGTVTDCVNHATIISKGNSAAGIVNRNQGIVEQCRNEADITSNQGSASGIAGYNEGTVRDCVNNGSVQAAAWGGGIAFMSIGTVERCGNTGAVTGGSQGAGGIVAYDIMIVRNCWNSGNVQGATYLVGGIVGLSESGALELANCWSTGEVTTTGPSAGGIAGVLNNCTATNCYTTHAQLVGELQNSATLKNVETKTEDQFAFGEVAYLLRTRVAEGVENVWGQNIDNGGTNEGVPVFSDAKVYQVDVNCAGDKGYSNTDASKVVHNYDDNGFCINPAANGDLCDAYEPAVEVKADNWESLGLTESYIGYYAITNAGQLYWFADKVDNENDVYRSAKAVLTDNITVNEGTVTAESSGLRHWNPIGGDYDTGFNGTFDGNHKTISGLYFNDEKAGCVGLISYGWYNTEVCNVTLSNSYLYGNVAVGGIIGYNRGRVTGCVNHATIHAADMSAGGIVGLSEGPIELCGNTGSISNSSNGNGCIGGIVGEYAYSVYAPEDDHLVNCWNTGDVTGTKLAGGIAGQFASGDIWPAVPMENCWSTGNVTGTESATTGGVVGLVSNARIVNCYAPQTNPVGELATSATAINVESKTIQQFASGEVAYLLQTRAAEGTNVWGQNLDNGKTVQTVPTFDGAAVYQIVANCAGDTGYSNTNENKGTHNYSENGFCINPDVNGDPCDDYQPAVEVKADNWESLGLTENYIGYYAISNAGQLYWFAEQVDNNASFASKNAVLTQNITVNQKVLEENGALVSDISSLRTWNPIGNNANALNGIFDGNGKIISGLYFHNNGTGMEAQYVGLIAKTDVDSVVKNVTLSDSYLFGYINIGGIVAYNGGVVTGCINEASFGVTWQQAGGIVGNNCGEVTNCINRGCTPNYPGNQQNAIGGIVGYNNGIVEQCGNDEGNINSNRTSSGGIVGVNGSIVRNCWNTGAIYANTDWPGGIVGFQIGGEIENCWSTGAITGAGVESENTRGGIVGCLQGAPTVRNCYSTVKLVGEIHDGGTPTEEKLEIKAIEQFASGEVAYLLRTNAADGTNVWGQDLDNGKTVQTVPTFDGASVYRVAINCAGDLGYSNTNENKGTHNYSENGFCINPDVNGDPCDDYQPAERLTAARCTELGLDVAYADYYAIKNAGNLYWFADKVDNENYAYETANVVLTKDITINSGTVTAESTGLRQWNPIGWYGDSYDYCDFNGIFDGNYKTISGLYFNTDAVSRVGLIAGTGEDALVKNVTLSNSYILAPCSGVGGIVGSNNGTISGCINNASVNAKNPNESILVADVGGIAGCNMGSIIGCINNGDIFSEGVETGGIAGWDAYKNCLVENCANTGTVTGGWAGGIMGRFDTGTIRNCWSIGEITGRDTSVSGGIVGFALGAEWAGTGVIQNCYATQIPGGDVREKIIVTDMETKTLEQFASGEVAYLLRTRAAEGTNAWGQDLDNGKTVQTVPTFDGAVVYRVAINCAGDLGYSNTNENKGTHNYSENGFCINPDVNGDPCDDYQPAERLTAARCTELGLDVAYADYYAIKNAGNLYWFADKVDKDNANFGSANAVLTADIVVNSGTITKDSTDARVWNPIGDADNGFSATFDGNGHSISGLYFKNINVSYMGLIAYADTTAVVRDVTLSNSYLLADKHVGGIVAANLGTVTGCTNNATIRAQVSGAGGIVGNNEGVVELCGNTGAIYSFNGMHSGGIASQNTGTVRNCWNTGYIEARIYWPGGIVGYHTSGVGTTSVVENCWSTGELKCVLENGVGGIVGQLNQDATEKPYGNTVIKNCYTTTETLIAKDWGGATVSQLERKTAQQFASGEVAYLLRTNAADGTNVWGQDLDNGKTVQTVPTFDGAAVYRGYDSCTDTAAKYTNDSTISPDPIPHDWKYTANGAQITGQCGYNCGTDSGKVTLTAPANTVYEGVEKTVTVAGALTDVTTLPQITYEGDRVNVGTFTAKLTVGDATAQLPVQIVPYELEIQTFVPETKVYDGTTTCGVKSLSFVSTANGEELVLGTDFSAVLTFPGTDAGEYTDVVLTVQLLDTPLASNYKLKNGTITGATHTITPATITVTDVKVEDKVYDGTTDATVTGVTISGVLAGETVSVKAEGVFADKNSGENKTVNLTYTLSGEDAGNYVLAEETGTTTAKITVKPLPEIMEPVKDLTVDNVTSEDKDALEDVKEELEHVLTDEGLSDEERKEREDALKDVQDMLDRIQEAADAIKTDPIIDTKHITAENVVPENREDIENALEDLYGALENYENNYTETEKDGIQDDIDRLEAALAALKAVEDVIKEIEELPDGVEPDTELRDDILDTKGKYDELPERLKDMIPQELVDKLNKLLADLKVYLIIKGDGQTWSEGALGFTANGPCDRFVQLLIDGNVVDASNYTVVSGSTVLTIKESYAKTLTGGKHSISFVYPDGQAVGSFTVVIPTNGSATTGDDANIVFWTGAMVVSLAALAVLLAESRKRRYAK